jgi:hypothetical protein
LGEEERGMTIRELKSITEFREALRRHEPIVITDSPRGHRFHQTPWACTHVTEDNFIAKVITNGGKNGGYYAVSNLGEAQGRWSGVSRCE